METRLADLFAFWNARYRGSLLLLLALGVAASGLVYAENNLLGQFLPSLSANDPGISTALRKFSAFWGLPIFPLVLLLFVIVSLISAAADFGRAYLAGHLRNRAIADAEATILDCLLHKDESFFSRHSPSETANRLGVDLYRVCDRRTSLMNAWSFLLLGLGSLAYFIQHDSLLALVAVCGCVAGAVWTQRGTRRVKQVDADYLRVGDRVKSHFEDVLRAAAEVQVGQLYDKVDRGFVAALGQRSKVYLRYVGLNSLLATGCSISYLAAFVSMILLVSWRQRTQRPNAALDLLPVVVFALPQLFMNASQLVLVRVGLKLAQTSRQRLLEYESRQIPSSAAAPAAQATVAAPASGPPSLRLTGVTYRYAGMGGVSQISTSFAPGTWTAVVGGAGSGKSTLLKLLCCQLRPQSGKIDYGSGEMAELDAQRVAADFSFMPQTPALLDASFEQNLLFGRRDAESTLSAADLEIIDLVGLGAVCRLKALDMCPPQLPPEGDVVSLRQHVGRQLAEKAQCTVRPYGQDGSDAAYWVLEQILQARCQREKSLDILLAPGAAKSLAELSHWPLGDRLIALGRDVLRKNARLLSLPNFDEFQRLSPIALDPRLWNLRAASVRLSQEDDLHEHDRLTLFRIALTGAHSERDGQSDAITPDNTRQADMLRGLLGDWVLPLQTDRWHPFLTWRENLIFGSLDMRNSREARSVDQTCLECAEEAGLGGVLLREGLSYSVGRLGSRLSGGQGQLLSLCRALLRRTPMLLLDEPTSALDPASRQRVAEFFGRWRQGRIIITVSHDPQFVKQADEVRVLDGGNLAASGTPLELAQKSEVFGNIMRQP